MPWRRDGRHHTARMFQSANRIHNDKISLMRERFLQDILRKITK